MLKVKVYLDDINFGGKYAKHGADFAQLMSNEF